MAATTTIRVTPETREALSALSAERGVTNADLVAELVTLEQERVLLAAMNKGFSDLAADPAAMEEYRAEQRIWDATLSDGLAKHELRIAGDGPCGQPRAPGQAMGRA